MTTKNNATTASKLASSVRRAKTPETEEEKKDVKASTPARKTPVRKPAAKKPATKKPDAQKPEQEEAVKPMGSNRVWPD
ncbi:hypothetical protein GHNINEIG_01085 [Hydrogenovibrio crunogenus]|uniref:Uncharacterized protein n=1 Tax=Hydrogenovibrio crunogenus TaxID=39765 RepID=A0A4V1C8T7_9GAMM|nr:hypothetical protein [Hydrogenovibrio crunogenus]QBZ83044.1 hypothetical protein GHNINEIG_01085 [Hydrogenovibrio crunogenus]